MLLLDVGNTAHVLHNILEVNYQSRQMLVFAMKAGPETCVSIILVKLWTKLALDVVHVLLQVILMPTVYVKMDSVAMIARRAVMGSALESFLIVALEVKMESCATDAMEVEAAITSGRVKSILLVVFARTSKKKNKPVRAEVTMSVN